jgi:uncharacterized protein YaaR (DUF327 family)
MAKVDSPDGIFNPALYNNIQQEGKKTRQKGGVRGAGRVTFSHILENTGVEASEAFEDIPPSEEALQQLLDAVHNSGDELKNRPLPDTIKQYKQAVRNFLHYVVKNGYTVEEQTSRTGLLKRKKYTLVQVADRKLEELAAAILSGQSGQLTILARIEEINGLLVDLLQ